MAAVLTDPAVTPEAVKSMMTGLYSTILVQQAPAYRDMFDRLAAGEVPLAFHCSAGKDRTGVGAALILSALGVPRETIVADYVMSDQLVDYRKAMALDAEPAADDPYAFLRQLPPDVVAPLLASDASYIEAAFAEMEARHGTVEAYLKAELGVTDEELATLRASLLEQSNR
jgi:protein-tyrosine phosphatase